VLEDELSEQYQNYTEIANSQGEEVISFEDFKVNYKTSVDRILLNYEKEILLHPRNAHHLLLPLTDEIFTQDIYNNMVEKGVVKTPPKSFLASMFPSVNVKNAIIFVKGKFGVGIAALGITNKSTNQADTLSISQKYSNQDGEVRPTRLLFKGLEGNYRLDSYTDDKGTIVSESQSQLLNTQVDNVKNPIAVLMNINMQTLNVVDYLIRRGVNPQTIIYLLNQPMIKKYLTAQKLNESLFNKNANSELSRKDLIKNVLNDNGYLDTVLPDAYTEFSIEDSKMLSNIQKDTLDREQLKYLAYFIDELQPQARAFSDFQQSQTSDTKGFKDKQMLDESYIIRERVSLSAIIPGLDVNRLDSSGVVSPFYQLGRKRYEIFDEFYSLADSVFGDLLFNFKNKASIVAPALDKDKVRQTIENDFMLFLIHNFVLNKTEFDSLLKDNSVAKRVQELKIQLPSNLVLKAFHPMLNNSTDKTDNRKIDNLRLFEKELTALDSNDMRLSLEEIADSDIELYTDIVKLLMFQSGLNISPFNYRAVVPVGLNQNRNEFNAYQYIYQDLLSKAVREMRSQIKTEGQAVPIFNQFITLFSANNPKFLKKNFNHSEYPYSLAKEWNRGLKQHLLKPEKGSERQIQLGDAYHKQYFSELINPNLGSNVKKDVTQDVDPRFLPKHIRERMIAEQMTSGKLVKEDGRYFIATEESVSEVDINTSQDPYTNEPLPADWMTTFEKVFDLEGSSSKNVPNSSDEFFPTESNSVQNNSVNIERIQKFETQVGLRNTDNSRKRFVESDYTLASNKLKRLSKKFPGMLELVKVLGEKGDSRVYYSIVVSDYGKRILSTGETSDKNLREKYFKDSSSTDAKSILQKISKSDSNLALLAKKLLSYVNANNVNVTLVESIGEPIFGENGDVALTRGVYYSRNSLKNPNSIKISESAFYPGGRSEGILIHEILHALTLEKIFDSNSDVVKNLQKIFEYVKLNSPKGIYALSNLDEFIAGIFTDAQFIKHLKTVPPLDNVKQYKNLFEEILDMFKKLFNITEPSVLEQVISTASNLISEVSSEKTYSDSLSSISELDQSTSNYSPSLKMYEGFIQLNQLYSGEEVLPFVGESEYYRYLVPMLLKMNPEVKTEFTENIKKSVFVEAVSQKVTNKNLGILLRTNFDRASGTSVELLNAGFISDKAETKTVVHELVHRTLQKEYEKKTEFYRQINDAFDHAVANSMNNSLYGYSSPTEFLAEALANPEFMEELNNIQYKEETLWSYLMTLVSDFMNNLLNVELKSDSVLAEVVKVSEQILNNNVKEMSKESPVNKSDVQTEILSNWNSYFPQYEWMNERQKQITAQLVEEGKITLICKI